MSRRLKFSTRGLGAEPGIPGIASLSAWVAEHRGTLGDLTTYRIQESLSPQLAAGIEMPTAGGTFMENRIMECLRGVKDRKVTDELSLNTGPLAEDGYGMAAMKRNVWSALPAPHFLGLSDAYYDDAYEWVDALARVYRTAMREMRDAGVAGHILISDAVNENEVTALSRREVVFFPRDPGSEGFKALFDRQRIVAVSRNTIRQALEHIEEYEIDQMILVDPDPDTINTALLHFDADQLRAGGYCTDACTEYWKTIVQSAEFSQRTG